MSSMLGWIVLSLIIGAIIFVVVATRDPARMEEMGIYSSLATIVLTAGEILFAFRHFRLEILDGETYVTVMLSSRLTRTIVLCAVPTLLTTHMRVFLIMTILLITLQTPLG